MATKQSFLAWLARLCTLGCGHGWFIQYACSSPDLFLHTSLLWMVSRNNRRTPLYCCYQAAQLLAFHLAAKYACSIHHAFHVRIVLGRCRTAERLVFPCRIPFWSDLPVA